MASDKIPFTHKVQADRLGDSEKTLVIEPDPAALERMAKEYGCLDITNLKAELTLKPWRKAGVRVTGVITADLKQECVVTLEPFEAQIREEVDRTYEAVSSRPRKPRDLNDDGEIEIELETLDPPDVMIDGVIDLGQLICEQLALTIDPFPRKPGVEFVPENSDDAGDEQDEKPSPFAVLAKLKQDPEDENQ